MIVFDGAMADAGSGIMQVQRADGAASVARGAHGAADAESGSGGGTIVFDGAMAVTDEAGASVMRFDNGSSSVSHGWSSVGNCSSSRTASHTQAPAPSPMHEQRWVEHGMRGRCLCGAVASPAMLEVSGIVEEVRLHQDRVSLRTEDRVSLRTEMRTEMRRGSFAHEMMRTAAGGAEGGAAGAAGARSSRIAGSLDSAAGGGRGGGGGGQVQETEHCDSDGEMTLPLALQRLQPIFPERASARFIAHVRRRRTSHCALSRAVFKTFCQLLHDKHSGEAAASVERGGAGCTSRTQGSRGTNTHEAHVSLAREGQGINGWEAEEDAAVGVWNDDELLMDADMAEFVWMDAGMPDDGAGAV